METSYVNKITGFVIALVLGAIMVGGVLAPTVAGIQDSQITTYTNNVVANMTFKLDGNDDYNLTTSPSVTTWTINGETINMYDVGGSIVITDKCRFDKNGGYLALFDASGARIVNMSAATNKASLDYTASTKTFTVTTYNGYGDDAEQTNEYTYSVENILYFIPGGNYGAIQTGGDPDITYYVNELSQVIAGGAYTTGDLDTSYFAEGLTVYVGNASYTATSSANSQQVIDGVIKGSSFAITVTDGEASETFTPYTVFVPLKVTGHTDNQIIYNTMFGVITLLGIVMLVVFAANAVRNKY